jgi:hypothetical protein
MILVIYPFLSVAALHKGLGTVGPVLLPFVVLLLQEAKEKTKSFTKHCESLDFQADEKNLSYAPSPNQGLGCGLNILHTFIPGLSIFSVYGVGYFTRPTPSVITALLKANQHQSHV